MLPSYLEQGNSSLIFMVDHFMKQSGNGSAYFLHDWAKLEAAFQVPFPGNTLLMGVSYALLDFAEFSSGVPEDTVVMETGGMKGRRKEIVREELHDRLKDQLGVGSIHSEYGMTELSSQAYSVGNGWFMPPPWMRAHITDINDPLSLAVPGKRGLLAFTDLANRDSCCFIQTRDIGVMKEGGAFKVEGRMDQSDVRGCNLLFS